MEISCPKCSSRFNLPDSVAKPGAKLRCTVCQTVFQLPGQAPPPKNIPPESPPPDRELLPEMPKRRKSRLWLWLSFVVLLLALAGGGAWYYFQMASPPPETGEEIAKKVERLTMRNVRQYNLLNEKVGKVFVIEGKVVNEFDTPRDFIELEGAIYDADKRVLESKRQLAGTQLSLFQLQVLTEKEMESFLHNKMEILANNTNVPPGGEVPFMILFYAPPDNVAEFGVRIVDVKTSMTLD